MSSSVYRNVLSTAQDRMSKAVAQIRSSVPHSGEIGGLVERVVRASLVEVLPEKVGVSNGFVVDSKGGVSRQMDIVLYDRANTPRIFTSGGAQMFPVESTYACGEVKTNLDSSAFEDCFDKCVSYKKLLREAYFRTAGVPGESRTHQLFGQDWDHWRSVFFCVAASSVSTDVLLKTYKGVVEHKSLPVHGRVDTVVALDATDGRNMLMNARVGSDGIPEDGSVDLLPSPGSQACTYRANEPWSLFVMLLLRYMTQAPTQVVNMLPYGGGGAY